MVRISLVFIALVILATAVLPAAAADARSPVMKALFRNDGKGFVPPAKNGELQALLATKPALTFFEACGVGDAAEVERHLKADPKLATSWNDFGWTPLHLAAFSGSAETALLLLERDAEVNVRAKTKFRNTPLQAALLTGQLDTAKLLLERGADANVRQSLGFTPLQEAALLGRRDLIDLLLAHGAEIPANVLDSAESQSPPSRVTAIQVSYYAKPGKADEVLAHRQHVSAVLERLGLPRGRVLRPVVGSGEEPDVIWECEFANAAALDQFLKAAAASSEFEEARKHMGTLIRKAERKDWEVQALPEQRR